MWIQLVKNKSKSINITVLKLSIVYILKYDILKLNNGLLKKINSLFAIKKRYHDENRLRTIFTYK